MSIPYYIPAVLSTNPMYLFVIILACIGLVGVSTSRDLLKKVISFSIFSVAIITLFLFMGYVDHTQAPIVAHHDLMNPHNLNMLYLKYSNPMSSVLMLTAIVVGIATQAIAFAIIARIKYEYQTLDEKQIFIIDKEFQDQNRVTKKEVKDHTAGVIFKAKEISKSKKVTYLTITDQAIQHINHLVKMAPSLCEGLKICFEQKGCSGLAYKIEYAQLGYNITTHDEYVQYNKTRVFIDPKISLLIIGTTMDYVDELSGSGFVFINPNEKGRCGCGQSFYA